jgi:hypothetical protein
MCEPLHLPVSTNVKQHPEDERVSGGGRPTPGHQLAEWALSPVVGLLEIAKAFARRQYPDRAEIERQLRRRARCPHFIEGAEATRKMAPGAEHLYPRLKRMIRKELFWPNALFLPEDPVRLLFIPLRTCFDDTYCIREIEDQFGIELSQAVLDLCTSMTLGEFAEFVATRQTVFGGHDA